jgi:hypothetical protein
MNSKTDELITRFLSGELSPEERTNVEERFFADNEFFQQLLSAEDSLIDGYVMKTPDPEEHKRARVLFESSSAQRPELKFTKDLINLLHERRPKNYTDQWVPAVWTNVRQHFGTLTFMLAGLLLLAGIFYLYSQKRHLESQQLAMQQSSEDARKSLREEAENRAELEKQLEIEKEKRLKAEELIVQLQSRRPDTVASILLAATTQDRGRNARAVSLNPTTRRIQFQLELDESLRYKQYSVLISTFDDQQIWSNNSIDASQIKYARLTVMLPSHLLKSEDYKIEVKGLSDNGTFVHVADYVFKVRR